jgi:hypothetical protein
MPNALIGKSLQTREYIRLYDVWKYSCRDAIPGLAFLALYTYNQHTYYLRRDLVIHTSRFVYQSISYLEHVCSASAALLFCESHGSK